MPTLTYRIPGESSPIAVELYKQITTIGRGPDNDIAVPDPLLAEDHAQIQFDGERFTISALERKNKIFINGRSRRQAVLKHGDRIKMGNTEFTFRMFSDHRISREEPLSPVEAYRKIYNFSRQLLEGSSSIRELLERLLDQVLELTNAERGFIIFLESGSPRVAVGRNIEGENLADAEELFSDSIISRVIQEKKPLIINNVMDNEKFKNAVSVLQLQLNSVMCVPLVERDKLLGVLYLGNSKLPNFFDKTSLELITIFAAQASLLLQNALLVNALELDNRRLQARLEEIKYSGIIGSCDSMLEVLNRVRKVATTDVSVLITGETGTGKELIAREIHRLSNRNKGPFVAVNCGAIPEQLLESELFGYVKGAFTGATSNREGKFQAAHKGTLFLDEVGELPINLQVKLLRAIEEKVITPLGGNRPQKVDIRILAATNRNLEEEIKKGNFREDLYFRLNVISIHLPPLRERGDDIVLLAKYFLQKFSKEYDRNIQGFTPQAISAIQRYKWPGNIRELENRIRKAVILADGTQIDTSDLELKEESLEPILPLSEAKERFQLQYIQHVLRLNNGNRTKTARDLGVDPRTIFRYLEKIEKKK